MGAPTPDDQEHTLLAQQILAALAAVLHGFITLEAAGGYAMELDLDESYHQMITGFDAGLRATTATSNRS